jgi:prepilin peptidase CpaA
MQVLVALVVIPAAIFDLKFRRVPNWLTGSGLVLGVGVNVVQLRTAGLWLSLEGAGLALLIYLPLYLLRGMGAGDVKLMTAVGAMAGPKAWLGIFVLTAFIGGVGALILVIARGRARKTFENIGHVISSASSARSPFANHPELDVRSGKGFQMPHAVIIACGALGFLLADAFWPSL